MVEVTAVEARRGPETIGALVVYCTPEGLIWAPQQAEASSYGKDTLTKSGILNQVLIFVVTVGFLAGMKASVKRKRIRNSIVH